MALRAIGEFQVEVKKTSIHLVRKSAFAGVHPQAQHLLLTIKAAAPVSKNRWHLEVNLTVAGEIDSELMGWLREAYALCV